MTSLLIAPVVTMDPAAPRASALAVDGDRILAVGSVDEVRAACPPDTPAEEIDGVIVPGLIDAHLHMQRGGLKVVSLGGSSWDAPALVAEMDRTFDLDEWPADSAPTPDDRATGLRLIQPLLHALGITSVVDPAVTADEMRAYQRAWSADELTMRVTAMPHATLSDLSGIGIHTGFGDDFLRIGGVKVYFDGEGMKRQALLETEWTPGSGDLGLQRLTDDEFLALASYCARHGWSLGVHAVGGGAVAAVLRMFAEIDRETPIRDLRWQLIHAYLEPSAESMALAARLGVVASLQPSIHWRNADGLIAHLGERAVAADPIRSWLDAGATVALGSDGPFFPFDPRHLMWKSRTRMARGLPHPVAPAQAITGFEALAGYTTGAAYAAFAERDRGMLRAGMLADWVALSVDPTTCDPEAIRTATVRRTVVGGRTVYSGDDL
ncbi:amidohydrolase [Actinoplanes rectilineatus]|uniref:amidohydrolase n=1 Tax=Actinoplanes rectilineatus TaxID=113571 RepID=UPI0005F29261|nr:amidohydrolase family protein [Actinoplanes rectilineatus]